MRPRFFKRGNEVPSFAGAFVERVEILDCDLELQSGGEGSIKASHWLQGFGVWSGGTMEQVESMKRYRSEQDNHVLGRNL